MDHLERRIEQLTERLGRKPSFLPVGREDVQLICQRYIEQNQDKPVVEMHEIVTASFSGILAPTSVFYINGVKLVQI